MGDRYGPAAPIRLRSLRFWLCTARRPAQEGEDHSRAAAQVRDHHHFSGPTTATYAGIYYSLILFLSILLYLYCISILIVWEVKVLFFI